MNLDHLPFTAFALESAGAAQAAGEAHTLTLPPSMPASLRAPRLHETGMNGIASIDACASGEGLLRAAVVPAEASDLTITF